MTPGGSTARALAWLSRVALAAAVLVAAVALFSRWGVGAQALGAHDLGSAIGLSFLLAVTLTGAFYAAPVLLAAGAVAWFFQRQSGYRFLAAAALCALPLAAVSLL